MAGRGTDIKLGEGVTTAKPSKVKDAEGKIVDVMEDGGLHIIGSERHESRRIDRQLRGRAGRQGDPGASQFFLSLEDDLMRLFGSDRIAKLMDAMGAKEGEVLTHSLITRSIEQAQKRVELQNFQSRKRLLEYDDVMNQQREVVYSLRSFALEGGEELRGEAERMIEKAVGKRVETAHAETEDDRIRASGCGDRGHRSVRSEDARAQRICRPLAVARDAERSGREVEGPSLRSGSAA
jgi:preprotein translocase subunit SecA